MTPNPAERERETTLIQHYRRFRIYLYPTVSLLSFLWIFVLVKVLRSLVVDQEFPDRKLRKSYLWFTPVKHPTRVSRTQADTDKYRLGPNRMITQTIFGGGQGWM